MKQDDFVYSGERFADLQLLRYRLNGFEKLSLRQKKLVYYLSQATLFGRDITFDQFGKYNLRIRKMLEVVYCDLTVSHDTEEFKAMELYLKRVWFSNGIYHHYGCDKFRPGFSPEWLKQQLYKVDVRRLPLKEGESLEQFCEELFLATALGNALLELSVDIRIGDLDAVFLDCLF
jgi:dipeptidyl-peptidase-3